MSKGNWLGIGVLVGAALMAATGEVYWIPIGAGVGAEMGAAKYCKKAMLNIWKCNGSDSV